MSQAGVYVPNYTASHPVIFTLEPMEQTGNHYLLRNGVSLTCHWEMSSGVAYKATPALMCDFSEKQKPLPFIRGYKVIQLP
jgi:hypothetical protein